MKDCSVKLLGILMLLQLAMPALAQKNLLEGRWDLTVEDASGKHPSWLEVNHSGHSTLTGFFVGIVGSARPVAKINYNNGKFDFTIPPQWENTPGDVKVEGTISNNKLSGIIYNSDGSTSKWTGVRAPDLSRSEKVTWAKPIKLFNGKDLNGWKATGPNQWVVENNILKNPRSGSNLISVEKFMDFKLRAEFRYPSGSNSGIYLRGRYELQITDSKGKQPLKDEFGAIYGFLVPHKMVARAAGEWQTYDITLIGREITVVANGETIIWKQIIPGPTGGALDSNEGEPGPVYLQGDHGPVEFRSIVITPALK